jgi:uncharacterized membrane protein YesL
MGSIFNPDSKFTHYTNKFSDLITLNLWFVLTSLPLVTIGASATAMHYVLLRIYRDELEYSITKNYFRAFRENFRQATAIWFVYVVFGAVLFVDLLFVTNPGFLKILVTIVSILLVLSLSWIFVLQSRYANPVHATIRNAVVFTIMHPMDTVLMCALMLLPLLLLIGKPSTIPIVIICGFSLTGIIRAMIYGKVFSQSEVMDDQTC